MINRIYYKQLFLAVFVVYCIGLKTSSAVPPTLGEIQEAFNFGGLIDGHAASSSTGERLAEHQLGQDDQQHDLNPTQKNSSDPIQADLISQVGRLWGSNNYLDTLLLQFNNSPRLKLSKLADTDRVGFFTITGTARQPQLSNTIVFVDPKRYKIGIDNLRIATKRSLEQGNDRGSSQYPQPDTEIHSNPIASIGDEVQSSNLATLFTGLHAWRVFVDSASANGAEHNGREGLLPSSKLTEEKSVIDLVKPQRENGNTSPNFVFEDTNGDGFVFIDIDLSGEHEAVNSELLLGGPEDLTAVFRIRNQPIELLSSSRFAMGGGRTAEENYQAIFSTTNETEIEKVLFNPNKIVLRGISVWELKYGTFEVQSERSSVFGGQGVSQFIKSTAPLRESLFNLRTD